MKINIKYLYVGSMAALLCLFVAGCARKSGEGLIPKECKNLTEGPSIYPDYRGIVIPPNIAPLDFIVQKVAADEYVVDIQGKDARYTLAGDDDGLVQFDTLQWRSVLDHSKGQTLKVTVYAHKAEGWVRYLPFSWQVAPEPIDDFLSYRLIEPGFEIYRQLGLYQRNLTNFDQHVIYENGRVYDDENNHCVNCHNYQNYSTRNMMFHIRGKH